MFFFLTVHWFPYHFCYCTLGWCLWQALLQKCFNLSRQYTIFFILLLGDSFANFNRQWHSSPFIPIEIMLGPCCPLDFYFLEQVSLADVTAECSVVPSSWNIILQITSLLFVNFSYLYFKFQLKFHFLYTLCDLSNKSESFHHTHILCNLRMYCVFSCKTFIKFF